MTTFQRYALFWCSSSLDLNLLLGSSGIISRQILVYHVVARGMNSRLATKNYQHSTRVDLTGRLGTHEVRVDFLPAADLDESGAEYKARMERQSMEAGRVSKLAEDTVHLARADCRVIARSAKTTRAIEMYERVGCGAPAEGERTHGPKPPV